MQSDDTTAQLIELEREFTENRRERLELHTACAAAFANVEATREFVRPDLRDMHPPVLPRSIDKWYGGDAYDVPMLRDIFAKLIGRAASEKERQKLASQRDHEIARRQAFERAITEWPEFVSHETLDLRAHALFLRSSDIVDELEALRATTIEGGLAKLRTIKLFKEDERDPSIEIWDELITLLEGLAETPSAPCGNHESNGGRGMSSHNVELILDASDGSTRIKDLWLSVGRLDEA